ncbi:radical SAM family heme chaperone HemW [Tepidibacter aestuarii]|uniref:radical SAM family heme chaperone HemW n=1 Tax=Tepidibacter aestuarii TaxID=2925782 RepID=UPI0020BFD73E|nr:radical SAM family heme chaperone HemW [Tepidibacter aestuarii]CAH2214137.1 Heme chaperone HemW [Tepidibacter aestuarii]
MERGLYVHVPFCIKKCNYCDFNSFKLNYEDKKNYIKSIITEMKLYSKQFDKDCFSTVFIGGGTPSILENEELKLLIDNIHSNFNISDDAEISIEANPGTLTKEKLNTLYLSGVNRLSMGLQSSDKKHLASLGRIHSYEEFKENFEIARKIGFENINVDLMFSLPDQTFDQWKQTLKDVIALNPSHISAYSLIIEDETVFGTLYDEGKLELLDEELDLKMYYYTRDYLKENGYNQYEISNYAKDKKECKHNILYWKCGQYLGLGPGSHSYLNKERFSNYKDIKTYCEKLKDFELPIEHVEKLDKQDMIEEKIFMGLRMNEGIDLKKFNKEFEVDFMKMYKTEMESLKNKNLVRLVGSRLCLTNEGIDISNKVFIEFLEK